MRKREAVYIGGYRILPLGTVGDSLNASNCHALQAPSCSADKQHRRLAATYSSLCNACYYVISAALYVFEMIQWIKESKVDEKKTVFNQRALFIGLSALTDSDIMPPADPPHSQIHTLTGENSRLNSIAFPPRCASRFHPLAALWKTTWADRIPVTEAVYVSVRVSWSETWTWQSICGAHKQPDQQHMRQTFSVY